MSIQAMSSSHGRGMPSFVEGESSATTWCRSTAMKTSELSVVYRGMLSNNPRPQGSPQGLNRDPGPDFCPARIARDNSLYRRLLW
jgi:hypothetical protein